MQYNKVEYSRLAHDHFRAHNMTIVSGMKTLLSQHDLIEHMERFSL